MSCDGYYGVPDPHHPRHEWNANMIFAFIILGGIIGAAIGIFFGG
jgi:hypothetical protein